MSTVIDKLAMKLQDDVNAEIKQACAGESWRRWGAIAERIAYERLTGDWEWLMQTYLGPQSLPQIAIGRYLK